MRKDQIDKKWYSQDELSRNVEEEIKNGTYMNDGCVKVTCLHCGTKRALAGVACCSVTKKARIKLLSTLIKGIHVTGGVGGQML